MYTLVRLLGYGIGILSLNGSLSEPADILVDNGFRVQELLKIDDNRFLFMCGNGLEPTEWNIRQFDKDEISEMRSFIEDHASDALKSRFDLVFN
jgi:hypothetical protein